MLLALQVVEDYMSGTQDLKVISASNLALEVYVLKTFLISLNGKL